MAGVHEQLERVRFYDRQPRSALLNHAYGSIAKKAKQLFDNTLANLIYVPAIREIRPIPSEDAKGRIDLSGQNLVPKLRQMQHPAVGRESEQELFCRIEKKIGDLLGEKDLKMEIPPEGNDIILMLHGIRLHLDHFGTGTHELIVLCSALMLHENRFVCIEEPEIHLHPELLRKFFRFLATTNNTYFIATHSNVLLDADETTVVYHVRHDGASSKIERSCSNEHTREILRDLSYRASDLLQTNCIIWVEGPSDRVYINKWLGLYGSDFIEGVHYSIMFYGGACLANVTVCDGGASGELVELLRINCNVIVVIDRDGDSSEEKLREYKRRIFDEVGQEKCWITQGREIENYLPPALIERYLKKRFTDRAKTVQFGPDEKIEECIKNAVDGNSFTYSSDKKGYARRLCEEMCSNDLDHLNLREWIARIPNAIAAWNGKP